MFSNIKHSLGSKVISILLFKAYPEKSTVHLHPYFSPHVILSVLSNKYTWTSLGTSFLFLCKILTASFILILPPEAACLSHFFLQLLHLQIYYSLFNQPTHWQTSGLFPDFYNYKPCFNKESSVNITSDCASIFGVVFLIWYCRLQG